MDTAVDEVVGLLTGRVHHTTSERIDIGTRIDSACFKHHMGGKPDGLWYSVGPAWWEWCRSEDFDRIERKRAFRLDIDTSDFLILSSDRAILAFTKRYGVDTGSRYAFSRINIDWPRIARDYRGIEIAPYSYELRCDDRTRWYYGWDVASGVLWDYAALRGATLIYEPPRGGGEGKGG